MILAPIVLALLQQTPPPAVAPVRPRDPFVFRCVLDKRARMLVAALDEEMWVAWDTTNGALVKAWKGGVQFDGAVYTTVHGPQPTSRGESYMEGLDGAPWVAYVDGTAIEAKATYLGYVLYGTGVTLEWKVSFGAREVLVREQPEFGRLKQWLDGAQLESFQFGAGMQPALSRTFEVVGARAGEQLNVKVRTRGALVKHAHDLVNERYEEVRDEQGTAIGVQALFELPLTAKMSKNELMIAFRPIASPAKSEEPR